MPSRSSVPGAKFSTTTSAFWTRSANTSRDPGRFKFSVTAYLPRKRFSAADERCILAAVIGRGGVLDLDDARAEAGQQEGRERAGQGERQVEHGQPGQGPGLTVCFGCAVHVCVGRSLLSRSAFG